MLLVLLVSLLLKSGGVDAQQGRYLEQSIKAAYLYQFGNYVGWPDSTFDHDDSPVVIGVADADDVAIALGEAIRGRTIDSRPVRVRRVTGEESLVDIHILFAGGPDMQRLQELLTSLEDLPVLIVTHMDNTFPPGAIINFVIVDDRVRFDADLNAARAHGLRISARLLSVARDIHGQER